MNYVWCEWICTRCKELHRMKFEIVTSLSTARKVKGTVQLENCYIEDVASLSRGKKSPTRHGSKIYVEWNIDISKIFSMLKSYMLEYYTIQEGSLKMDMCREGSYGDSS